MLTLENRTKILTALRSGEFKQGRNQVYDGYGNYCCIGVAGVACGLHVDSVSRTLTVGREVGFLDDKIDDLIELNDCKRKSFAEIADVIESFPVAA